MEEKTSLSWVLLGTAFALTSVAMALHKANKRSEALHAHLESLQSANR